MLFAKTTGAVGAALAALVVALIPMAASASGSQASADLERIVGPPAGHVLVGRGLEEATEAVASLMRCPVCQGLSVATSDTELARSIRVQAQEMLQLGYTQDQVLDYFEYSYGEFIRLAPKPEGFNLVVWIAPGLALLIGIGLVTLRLRGQRPPTPVEASVPSPEDSELDAYLSQVRREVGPSGGPGAGGAES